MVYLRSLHSPSPVLSVGIDSHILIISLELHLASHQASFVCVLACGRYVIYFSVFQKLCKPYKAMFNVAS